MNSMQSLKKLSPNWMLLELQALKIDFKRRFLRQFKDYKEQGL